MRWGLFKGFWDRWLKEEDAQLRQWFRELDSFLSRIFRNRISLRDNIFCSFVESEEIETNVEVVFQSVLNFPLEGVTILKASEEGSLTWRERERDLIITFHSSEPKVNLKLCLFFEPVTERS